MHKFVRITLSYRGYGEDIGGYCKRFRECTKIMQILSWRGRGASNKYHKSDEVTHSEYIIIFSTSNSIKGCLFKDDISPYGL